MGSGGSALGKDGSWVYPVTLGFLRVPVVNPSHSATAHYNTENYLCLLTFPLPRTMTQIPLEYHLTPQNLLPWLVTLQGLVGCAQRLKPGPVSTSLAEKIHLVYSPVPTALLSHMCTHGCMHRHMHIHTICGNPLPRSNWVP